MFDQYFLTIVDFTGSRMGPNNTIPVIPSTPTVLVATADSDSIGLTWTENGTYDKVFIDRKDTGDYVALSNVNGGVAAYDDTTAISGITYTYKVKGVRNGFPSLYSNAASDMIAPNPQAATGTITVTNYLLITDSDVITIGSSTLTGADFSHNTSNSNTANDMADAINSVMGIEVAALDQGTGHVGLTALVAGSVGNSIGLSTDSLGITMSGTHLTGGSD